jgi:hypothetical protein
MINISISLLKYCALILIFGVLTSFAQQKPLDPAEQKVTIQMEKKPLGDVFRFLMENYEVSIGLERSSLDIGNSDYDFQPNLPSVAKSKTINADGSIKIDIKVEREFLAKEHTITLDIKDGTLKDAMDQIVDQMDNYKWEFNSSVVNIFPAKGRDDRFKEMLEMKIAKFTLPAGSKVDDITFHLIALPAFQQWLKKNKFHINPVHTGSSILLNAQYGRKLDEELAFSNLTFRELLNEITKKKKGGWIFRQRNFFTNGEAHIDLDI